MPSAAYRARTPPVPVASSSGWACTAISVKGRSVMKNPSAELRQGMKTRCLYRDPGARILARRTTLRSPCPRAAPVPRSIQPCRPHLLFPVRPVWPCGNRRFDATDAQARPARLGATSIPTSSGTGHEIPARDTRFETLQDRIGCSGVRSAPYRRGSTFGRLSVAPDKMPARPSSPRQGAWRKGHHARITPFRTPSRERTTALAIRAVCTSLRRNRRRRDHGHGLAQLHLHRRPRIRRAIRDDIDEVFLTPGCVLTFWPRLNSLPVGS